MSQPRVTMFVHNTVRGDNRVLKEAAALAGKGCGVSIVGITGDGLPAEEVLANGVRIYRVEGHGVVRARLKSGMESRQQRITRRLGKGPLAKAGRFVNRNAFRVGNRLSWKAEPLLYMAEFNRAAMALAPRIKADIWHAHDLNTLATALHFRAKFGGKAVYDSHEYWLDCNNVYTPFAQKTWAFLERTLIGRADAVITVSESIADKLKEQYGIARPRVVLNTPEAQRTEAAGRLREKFAITTEKIVVYVGLITHKRGYEQLIDAAAALPEVTLVFLGPGNPAYCRQLADLARARGVAKRVVFAESVPPDEIQAWIKGADAGVSLGQPGALSYEMALPSKFFEYVFSGVPVVVSDFVELRRLVNEFHIGECVDPTNGAAIADGLRRVFARPERFQGRAWEARVADFAERYSWSSHKNVLVDLVDDLLAGAS